jgi:hypothetical protein
MKMLSHLQFIQNPKTDEEPPSRAHLSVWSGDALLKYPS